MQPKPDPTPEQIKQRSAEVQRAWSKDQERKRRLWSINEPAEIREVSVSDLAAE